MNIDFCLVIYVVIYIFVDHVICLVIKFVLCSVIYGVVDRVVCFCRYRVL